jgi:hypothetical protein
LSRLQTSISCLACIGATTGGCFPLEPLSSYSAGSAPSEGSADALDASNGGTSSGGSVVADAGRPFILDAGEGNSNEQELDPSAVDLEEPAAPVLTCAGPGEFGGLSPTTCYRRIDAVSSWVEARSSCQDWGGDLVEITTPEENELIAAEVGGSVWIGANDRQNEGQMVWGSGAPVDYATWAPAQPDNFQGAENCVESRAPDGLWNDAPCGGAKGALCERSD